jgi:hypothetical protein
MNPFRKAEISRLSPKSLALIRLVTREKMKSGRKNETSWCDAERKTGRPTHLRPSQDLPESPAVRIRQSDFRGGETD